MKILVAQIGSRHHYAIPRMFEQHGRLERLYTDCCASKGLGRATALFPSFLVPNKLLKLRQRVVKGVPFSKIYTADCLLLEQLKSQLGVDCNPCESDRLSKRGKLFSQTMEMWGLGEASVIYSMFGEGRDFLWIAKKAGLKIAVDVFITPVAHRIVREEQQQFPDWEPNDIDEPMSLENNVADLIDLADLLICPGENVVDGLSVYENFNQSKACVVPYGNGIDYKGRVNEPQTGRILFSGTACLRKGVHYYALAANQLKLSSRRYDFRLAGGVSELVLRRPECSSVNFLGQLPRSEMIEEFMKADVFVLPTLAEGSASVIYEALGAGVPVVTTKAAGSVVTDGVDGFIVPERDVNALAEAIENIVQDRSLRERLAKAALEKARTFTEEVWGDRLLSALARLDDEC